MIFTVESTVWSSYLKFWSVVESMQLPTLRLSFYYSMVYDGLCEDS